MKNKLLIGLLTLTLATTLFACGQKDTTSTAPSAVEQENGIEVHQQSFSLINDTITLESGTPFDTNIENYVQAENMENITMEVYGKTSSTSLPIEEWGLELPRGNNGSPQHQLKFTDTATGDYQIMDIFIEDTTAPILKPLGVHKDVWNSGTLVDLTPNTQNTVTINRSNLLQENNSYIFNNHAFQIGWADTDMDVFKQKNSLGKINETPTITTYIVPIHTISPSMSNGYAEDISYFLFDITDDPAPYVHGGLYYLVDGELVEEINFDEIPEAGTYEYQVVAVDKSGNQSEPQSFFLEFVDDMPEETTEAANE